jgi:hypothetical protein
LSEAQYESCFQNKIAFVMRLSTTLQQEILIAATLS